jgi:hypothetical protein
VNLLLNWKDFLSVNEFVAEILGCEFSAIPPQIIDNYKTSRNSRTSSDFLTTVGSSVASSRVRSIDGFVNCSEYRRTEVGNDFFQWDIDDVQLTQLCLRTSLLAISRDCMNFYSNNHRI